jgi:hypothetical protein
LIPGPIIELRATAITDDSVTLTWQPPVDSNAEQYVVHYSMIDELASKAASTSFEMDQQLNVTKTQAVITNLKSKQLYNFFVLAVNDHERRLTPFYYSRQYNRHIITLLFG